MSSINETYLYCNIFFNDYKIATKQSTTEKKRKRDSIDSISKNFSELKVSDTKNKNAKKIRIAEPIDTCDTCEFDSDYWEWEDNYPDSC